MPIPITEATGGISKESPAVVVQLSGNDGIRYIVHRHPEYELQLMRRGEGVYFIRDGQQPFAANDLIVIRPGDAHGLFIPSGKHFDKIRLAFRPQLLRDRPQVAQLIDELPVRMHLTEEETIHLDLALRSIESELSGRDEWWREAILADLEKLAYAAKRVALKKRPRLPQHRGVRRVLAHIEQHFAQSLPLKRLADVAGLSPNYLCSLFTRSTGTNLKQYILQRRIAEAARLLVDCPDLRVTDIALAVGFAHFADFNRNFRKITGLTPTSYRKISHINVR